MVFHWPEAEAEGAQAGAGRGGAGGSRGGARFSGGGWVAVWDLLARGRLGSSFSAREQLRPWWPP